MESDVGEVRRSKAFLSAVLLLSLLNLNITSIISAKAQDEPPAYFQITLVAPTNAPVRVQIASLVAAELKKIQIDAGVMLVGWDVLIERLFKSHNFEGLDGDGFDIGFIEWPARNPLSPNGISQHYHSNRIDKVAGANNYYPINNSQLDDLCDLIDSELDFDQRREWLRQALQIIVWDVHPVMGLYQPANPFAIDNNLHGFDAFRWGQPNIHVPELYYTDAQTVFKFATNARFIDLNPALSSSYYDSIIHQPTQAWTYQRDASMLLRPVLATAEPIAIGSNDTIVSSIDLATISPDSPYSGADASTTWGPSPNVDSAQYNPHKTAADKSMFLINLREDIPYQPGYGYPLGAFNVTVEDFQWTLGYWQNEDLASPNAQFCEGTYGPESSLAIEKINDTCMKVNLRGRSANGQIGDWFDALALSPLPRHVLDPTFNATPWGGDIGVTPDGTTIAAYINHSMYEYNTGKKPVIGVGPYCFENWDETTLYATLKKFEHWGGYGVNSLWNTAAYSQNNIDTYGVKVYSAKEAAGIDLENGVIDGIDAQFQMGSDIPYLQTKPNIQVLLVEGGGIQSMGYNTYHSKLSNRYVRLAISHMVPAQKIVDFVLGGLGSVNEIVGITLNSPYAPTEEEWQDFGLPTSENVVVDGKEIKFQGHIRYDLDKARVLMERAGYDMEIPPPPPDHSDKSENPTDSDPFTFPSFNSATSNPVVIIALMAGAAGSGAGFAQFLLKRRR